MVGRRWEPAPGASDRPTARESKDRALSPAKTAQDRWLSLGYRALVVVLVALVWLAPTLPTQDGPSHVYGLSIVADLTVGTGPWSEHFELLPAPAPNLGFLAIGLPLARGFGSVSGAWVAERAVVTLYLLVVALGIPYLLRSFGRRTLPAAFLGPPLALNYPLFLGFYSCVLGCAFFLVCLGILWRLRDRHVVARSLAATILAVTAALIHLIGGGLVILAAGMVDVSRCLEPGLPPRWRLANAVRAFVVVAPFAAIAGAYAFAHPSETLAILPVRHSGLVLAWLLLTLGTVSLHPVQMAPACIAGLGVLAGVPWRAVRVEHATRYLAGTALALVAAFLALPNFVATGGFLNERLPWMLPLVLLPILRWPVPIRKRTSAPLRSVLVVGLAVTWLLIGLIPAGRLSLDLPQTGPDLPPGETVAVARFSARPLWPLFDPWLHTGSRVSVESRTLDLAFSEFYMAHYPLAWRHPDWPAGPDIHDLYYRPREASSSAWSTPDHVVVLDAEPHDRAWLAIHCRPSGPGECTDDPDESDRRVGVWSNCSD